MGKNLTNDVQDHYAKNDITEYVKQLKPGAKVYTVIYLHKAQK